MWALLVLKSLEITLCGSNWDRKTAGRKLLWNLHCRDVLNVSATERLQQKALNTIKKRHRETSMKITMSWYFKPQVMSSCTETCRLLKIIELLMFNYRRADQLDLWKENTPYVFVRLIKQLNCSLNIIRTNNCRKSNCMHWSCDYLTWQNLNRFIFDSYV